MNLVTRIEFSPNREFNVEKYNDRRRLSVVNILIRSFE